MSIRRTRTKKPRLIVGQSGMKSVSTLADRKLGAYEKGESEVITPRQVEILWLFACGWRAENIASALEISVWTVREHVKQIFWAFDVGNMAGAVSAAYRRGIFEISPSRVESVRLPLTYPLSKAPKLSRRQTEVLHLLAAGWTLRAISEALGIGYTTARKHYDSARLKFGTSTMCHTVAEAYRLGLIP